MNATRQEPKYHEWVGIPTEAYETIHGALVAEWKSKLDGDFSCGFTCKVKARCLQDMNYQWMLNNPEIVAEQEENYRISLLNGELKE